jgi:hypothetical protein
LIAIPGMSARRIAANAWEVRIPRTELARKLSKRGDDPLAWDDAVFAIDGVETEPSVGSGLDPDVIRVTAILLG